MIAAALSHLKTIVSLVLLRSGFWQRSTWHRLGRLTLWLAYCYLGVLLMLLFLENWLLFHPTPASRDWAPPPSGLAVEDVELTSSDGTALHGWWAKPSRWHPDHGALLYFHGNAGNLSYRGDLVKGWRDKLRMAVFIVDYPGFGKSQGQPTEAGCYAAGEAAYDWITRVARVSGERLILLGGSLGGAPATELATRHPYRALILIAAFTSFPDMAQKSFPWLPSRWLVRTQMNNLKKIATLHQPVFIAHGTDDGLVPFSQGERLFAAANEPKHFFPMVGHGHDEGHTHKLFEKLIPFLNDHDVAIAQAN
jgi:fermentation-respiration switch protein FrsA (DUF1100 family)